MDVLDVSSQAELDQLYAAIGRWERAPIRVIELAVHDGLKKGDKRDLRPDAQRPLVQDEYAEFIGASRVLWLPGQ